MGGGFQSSKLVFLSREKNIFNLPQYTLIRNIPPKIAENKAWRSILLVPGSGRYADASSAHTKMDTANQIKTCKEDLVFMRVPL